MEEIKELTDLESDFNKLEITKKKKVVTEDLGKIFERAICLLYDIEYDSKYKYSIEEAKQLKFRIEKLKKLFPYTLKHTAKRGYRYDFTVTGINETKENKELKDLYLSAKTTKGDGKVCPQVIGQPSKKKFCEYFKIPLETEVRPYIINNIKTLLSNYEKTTFDCPIIYYNKEKDKVLFIRPKGEIKWTASDISFEFSHIKNNKEWKESSTLYINKDNKTLAIGEFQIHNKRNCIKFRWNFENILDIFKDKFDVSFI